MDALDADLSRHDLSVADFEVLTHLAEAPDRMMRMSELADLALVSKSRLSHRMKVMEKAGWVRRESCPTDKRGSYAVMTEKGLAAFTKASPDHRESVRMNFATHLTAREQADLAKIFNGLMGKLRGDLHDGAITSGGSGSSGRSVKRKIRRTRTKG
jgi:DNA-binding MarR family transcriptional regulator